MENLTDEMLIEMAAKYFPNIPQEKVLEVVEELRANVEGITNEQIMFIAAEKFKGKSGEATPMGKTPLEVAPESPQGRFAGLKNKVKF